MSLRSELVPPIPEETVRVAEAVFPKGNIYMRMRDELGTFYQDEQFVSLFSLRGQPAESPWRLALICVMQFVENLSDRQAAEAVRARIDWKYALSLELTDAGFDYSVLSEFRARLLKGGMEKELLDTMLRAFEAHSLLKQRNQQRTDSSHVVAAIRALNRLESVGETLRAALNSLAAAAPQWLQRIAHPDWFDRYGRRIEEYRLPKGKVARQELAETIGADGMQVLNAVYSEDSPAWLREIPAVETLRRSWVYQYYVREGQVCLREAKDLPPASLRFDSPYDPEARYGTKRDIHWIGYKVHLTETCDEDAPHVITHVETTIAPQSDVGMTTPIHEALADKNLLPREHLVDGGYVDAEALVSSQRDYQVNLVGPAKPDIHWQAHQEEAYSIDRFEIDWQARMVTCPQGQTTKYWKPTKDAYGNDVICIRFSRPGCQRCKSRALCTRSEKESRSLTLRPQAQHQALQETRQRQETLEWTKHYHKRAGIEGTLSQGMRGFGLRKARYLGLAKTHLQQILTATAINLVRVDAWLIGTPLAKTRASPLKALHPSVI